MATKRITPSQKSPTKRGGKNTANARWDKVALPAGFRAITTGDYGAEWEYEENPLLHGVVQGDVREVEAGAGKNKRVSRVIGIKSDDDGRIYTLWESASLKAFFDHVQRNMLVAVAFHGYREVGKPQPMKVFEGAFTEEAAAAIAEDGEVPPPKKPVTRKGGAKPT